MTWLERRLYRRAEQLFWRFEEPKTAENLARDLLALGVNDGLIGSLPGCRRTAYVPIPAVPVTTVCDGPDPDESVMVSVLLYSDHGCPAPERCMGPYMHNEDRRHLLDLIFRRYPQTRARIWEAAEFIGGAWPFAVAQVDLKRILLRVLKVTDRHG